VIGPDDATVNRLSPWKKGTLLLLLLLNGVQKTADEKSLASIGFGFVAAGAGKKYLSFSND